MTREAHKQKALLVYPKFPDTYWSFKHALPLAGKHSAFPPLGLLTLSSMLPSSWEKRLVDMNVSKLREADLEVGRQKWTPCNVHAAARCRQNSCLYAAGDR